MSKKTPSSGWTNDLHSVKKDSINLENEPSSHNDELKENCCSSYAEKVTCYGTGKQNNSTNRVPFGQLTNAQIQPKNSGVRYTHLHKQCNKGPDARFRYFSKSLFKGKVILDIGCNVGCMASLIAEFYEPKILVAVDINPRTISAAQRHIQHHVNLPEDWKKRFIATLPFQFGPLYRLPLVMGLNDPAKFPNNLMFVRENYVLKSDEELRYQCPKYDTILCLRVTMWIHLKFGDTGLKRAYKRMYAQLKCGGQLILEPQPWEEYSSIKHYSEAIYNAYSKIELIPRNFVKYLLSKHVGFSSCKEIGTLKCSNGYKQPLYLLTKDCRFSCAEE